MTKQTTKREEQFPTLFTDGKVRVFKNPTNEIFVQNIASGAQMRICATPGGLQFTAFGFRVEPEIVANGIGYLVTPK